MKNLPCDPSKRASRHVNLLASLALGAACAACTIVSHGEERALRPDEVELEVYKDGATATERGNDIVDCGGYLVWGRGIATKSSAEGVSRCLRARGYTVREDPPVLLYEKEGASPAQERRDAAECGGTFQEADETIYVRNLEFYDRCMRAKGYAPRMGQPGEG